MLNGRSVLRMLVQVLSPGCVWLPSFLCPSLVLAIANLPTTTRFFAINDALCVENPGEFSSVSAGDLVVLIDYFGFPFAREIAVQLRAQGAVVVGDASQALLSTNAGGDADFTIFSPRKSIGVPDGAVLHVRAGRDFVSPPLQVPPAEWWLQALSAVQMRGEFDRHAGVRDWFSLAQRVERHQPLGSFRMSELTYAALHHAFDYREIADRRILNFRLLADALGELALFPELPPGVVPLGFPIRVRDRETLLESLYSEEIYPAVHWRLDTAVPTTFTASHRLSAQIMTLPCDQRCSELDLRRMIDIVRRGHH
jgi:dTDP-4-amino-4,6-dideoxygalactose transaminase